MKAKSNQDNIFGNSVYIGSKLTEDLITFLCRKSRRVDEKTMIRNRSNRIPHPAPDTKSEKEHKDGIK